MKPLSYWQFEKYLDWILSILRGARLQGVRTDGVLFVLDLYIHSDWSLVFDLAPNQPQLILWEGFFPLKNKKDKPLSLFLRAHAKNLFLNEITMTLEKGRVLVFDFSKTGNREDCHLEFVAIPRNVNLVAQVEGKSLSWQKPRALPLNQQAELTSDQLKEIKEVKEFAEDWAMRAKVWYEEKFFKPEKKSFPLNQNQNLIKETRDSSSSAYSNSSELKALEKKLSKKEIAIETLQKELEEKEVLIQNWRQLGEMLKTHGYDKNFFLEQKMNDLKLYEENKSLSWNIENSFNQAKILENKKRGGLERIEHLKKEKIDLQKNKLILESAFHPEQPNPASELNSNPSSNPSLASELNLQSKPNLNSNLNSKLNFKNEMKNLEHNFPSVEKKNKVKFKDGIKTRKLILEQDGLEVYLGKSAKDNLMILRQARAWDYWFHLKDFPGAHGILFRNKNQIIPLKIIEQVSLWLFKETMGQKKINKGSKFDVVMVECRHVRPIRGDKLGRVTYHFPQVYTFSFSPDIS